MTSIDTESVCDESSPYAWEIQDRHGGSHAPDRIIPAHMGSMQVTGTDPTSSTNHAHTRGKYAPLTSRSPAVCESSHTRGKQSRHYFSASNLNESYPHAREAHSARWQAALDPRMIPGKHNDAFRVIDQLRESFPHERESLAPAKQQHGWKRIIPMPAGSTPPCARWPAACMNHPHEYGNYRGVIMKPRTPGESSPHVWETQAGERPPILDRRIIPTRVGSTA